MAEKCRFESLGEAIGPRVRTPTGQRNPKPPLYPAIYYAVAFFLTIHEALICKALHPSYDLFHGICYKWELISHVSLHLDHLAVEGPASAAVSEAFAHVPGLDSIAIPAVRLVGHE